MNPQDKLAQRYVALEVVAAAAREYRVAQQHYIDVTAKLEDVADNPEWQIASRTELDRELDLYIALDALDALDASCHS
jgi:hypothetical protein